VAELFPSFQSKTVTIDGVNLHYFCGGSGPPLVLVHGLGSSASVEFYYNLEPLAAHHRVFAIDLPGFGRSDKPVLAYTIDLFVRAVSDLMASEGIERAAVMGVSMGGRVALGLALDSPEKVERLVLVDALGIGAPRRVLAYSVLLTRGLGELTLRGTARALRQMNPAIIRRFWGWYLKRPNRVDAIWSDERIASHGSLLATPEYRAAYLSAAAAGRRRGRRSAARAANADAADLGRPRPHFSGESRPGGQGPDSQWPPPRLRRQRPYAADGGTGAVQPAGAGLSPGTGEPTRRRGGLAMARSQDPSVEERHRLADERDRLADERETLAEQRERLADERQHQADARERALDERQRAIEQLEQRIRAHGRFVELEGPDSQQSAIDAIRTAREQIERSRLALDRSAASLDRQRVRRDRAAAGTERDQAEIDRELREPRRLE